jgi:AcrR family transcriptional regulator
VSEYWLQSYCDQKRYAVTNRERATATPGPGPAAAKRPYRSGLRAAQAAATRAAVLDAAGRLFEADGYAATTMAAIAAEAGVSAETVYAQGSKASLLTACVDRAMAGDDQPVPVLERDDFPKVLASGDQQAILRAWGSSMAAMGPRTARINAAFGAAAAADPAIAEAWAAYEQARWNDFRKVVSAVAAAGPLPEPWADIDTATDLIWALLSPSAGALILQRNWTPDVLAARAIAILERLLLPAPR